MAQQATHSPAFVTRLTPEPVDTAPCEYQPNGVDEEPEEKEYQSLEEALLGE